MPRVSKGTGARITDFLADPYKASSLSGRARERRWRWLAETFPHLAEMRVLDLGGRPESWEAASVRPRQVVLLNVEALSEPPADWIIPVQGDALDPPDLGRFDLVYSNSVIEHVGGYARRRTFAESVERLAPSHWIQTPYRYFPLEPHWLFPGFQFLPLPARAALSRLWPLGLFRPPDHATAVGEALGVEIISITELRYLFPESRIMREKALGLVKSLIAVRARADPPDGIRLRSGYGQVGSNEGGRPSHGPGLRRTTSFGKRSGGI